MKILGKVLAFPIRVIARVIGTLFGLAILVVLAAGGAAAAAIVLAAVGAAVAFILALGVVILLGMVVTSPLRAAVKALDPESAVEEDSTRIAIRKIMESAQ